MATLRLHVATTLRTSLMVDVPAGDTVVQLLAALSARHATVYPRHGRPLFDALFKQHFGSPYRLADTDVVSQWLSLADKVVASAEESHSLDALAYEQATLQPQHAADAGGLFSPFSPNAPAFTSGFTSAPAPLPLALMAAPASGAPASQKRAASGPAAGDSPSADERAAKRQRVEPPVAAKAPAPPPGKAAPAKAAPKKPSAAAQKASVSAPGPSGGAAAAAAAAPSRPASVARPRLQNLDKDAMPEPPACLNSGMLRQLVGDWCGHTYSAKSSKTRKVLAAMLPPGVIELAVEALAQQRSLPKRPEDTPPVVSELPHLLPGAPQPQPQPQPAAPPQCEARAQPPAEAANAHADDEEDEESSDESDESSSDSSSSDETGEDGDAPAGDGSDSSDEEEEEEEEEEEADQPPVKRSAALPIAPVAARRPVVDSDSDSESESDSEDLLNPKAAAAAAAAAAAVAPAAAQPHPVVAPPQLAAGPGAGCVEETETSDSEFELHAGGSQRAPSQPSKAAAQPAPGSDLLQRTLSTCKSPLALDAILNKIFPSSSPAAGNPPPTVETLVEEAQAEQRRAQQPPLREPKPPQQPKAKPKAAAKVHKAKALPAEGQKAYASARFAAAEAATAVKGGKLK